VGLEPLSVVLCLHIVSYVLILLEEFDLFLAREHRADWEKNLDLIIKTDCWILKLPTGFEKTISEVEVVVCILMKSIEDSIYLNIDPQVLEDDPDDPLDFLSVGCGEQLAKGADVVFGRVHELVQHCV
jgi:hypothetical protein